MTTTSSRSRSASVSTTRPPRARRSPRSQKVDCAEPHIWEAYESIIVEEGDGTYPGEDVVTAQSETDCKAAFADYVGIDYDSSTLYLSFYYPTEETWTQINDREILCIVTTTDDFATKTTGSVKGSAK